MKYVNPLLALCRYSAGGALVLATFLLFTCSCGGGNSTTEEPVPDTPRLLSSVPADGAKDIPDGNLTVVLTFDRNVRYASSDGAAISAGEAKVGTVSVQAAKVSIGLSGLAKGKTYTLTVPKGMITGADKSPAEAVSVTFHTVTPPAPVSLQSTLCTPNPLPQAKKVYDYLLSIYGKKTLSGSMANVAWNIAEAELVYKAVGKYPAIAFFDYIHLGWSPANWIDYSDTKTVESWWGANGLVGASWHWMVPSTAGEMDLNKYSCMPGDGKKNSKGEQTTAFRAKNIFVEGSWENQTAKADLEKMAGYLMLLQDKGIPVIWRPLHEAAGNIYEYTGGTAWFWWGYDGAETYKRLWRYMFDYFKEKGIRNLIWVWTTQTKDADFYPGDEYVDIVGRDIYSQTSGADNAAQYSLICGTYPQKMVALSECGGVAKISDQWSANARWAFFMPWYHYNATALTGHQHADEAWWQDAMNNDNVVSRDRLPSLK